MKKNGTFMSFNLSSLKLNKPITHLFFNDLLFLFCPCKSSRALKPHRNLVLKIRTTIKSFFPVSYLIPWHFKEMLCFCLAVYHLQRGWNTNVHLSVYSLLAPLHTPLVIRSYLGSLRRSHNLLSGDRQWTDALTSWFQPGPGANRSISSSLIETKLVVLRLKSGLWGLAVQIHNLYKQVSAANIHDVCDSNRGILQRIFQAIKVYVWLEKLSHYYIERSRSEIAVKTVPLRVFFWPTLCNNPRISLFLMMSVHSAPCSLLQQPLSKLD